MGRSALGCAMSCARGGRSSSSVASREMHAHAHQHAGMHFAGCSENLTCPHSAKHVSRQRADEIIHTARARASVNPAAGATRQTPAAQRDARCNTPGGLW